jgi:hypothetical protein
MKEAALKQTLDQRLVSYMQKVGGEGRRVAGWVGGWVGA